MISSRADFARLIEKKKLAHAQARAHARFCLYACAPRIAAARHRIYPNGIFGWPEPNAQSQITSIFNFFPSNCVRVRYSRLLQSISLYRPQSYSSYTGFI